MFYPYSTPVRTDRLPLLAGIMRPQEALERVETAKTIESHKYKQKREAAQNKGHTRRKDGRAANYKHKRDECILVFCLNIQCRTMHILRLIYRRPGLYKQLALLAQ
jgi:hypothetical protein